MLKRIIDDLNLSVDHMRSISLSRDLRDKTAIASYLPTPNAVHALKRIGTALAQGQSQRAWKVVGPYGSGKSALGIVLAQLLEGARNHPAAWEMLHKASAPVATLFANSRRFALAVVGARLSIGLALGVEIQRALDQWPQSRGVQSFKKHLREPGMYKGRPINAVAGELMRNFTSVACSQGFSGTVLLLDEIGKFIEHAAMHPEAGDLIALQQLAEDACQQDNDSLVIVALQHQHFSSYAAGIGRALGDEWHKIASRFEEIAFDEPVERYAHFAAHALGTKPALLRDAKVAETAREFFGKALALSILRAPTAADKALFQRPEKLYPLHPLSLVALTIVSKRYGQSERSFHAFLNGNEPAGLRDYVQVTAADGRPWYRLIQVFDYLASGNGLRFRDLAAERRWTFAVTSVERQACDEDSLLTLKTIAVLELVQAPLALRITPELVAFALGQTMSATKILLNRLVDQGLLVCRHSRSEYGFAVSEAVNIEALYEHAAQTDDSELAIYGAMHALDNRTVIGSRHYDYSGTIRTLGITVGTLTVWPLARGKTETTRNDTDRRHPDGWLRLILALAGSPEERQALDRIRDIDDPLDIYCCLSLSPQGRAALAELAIWLNIQHEVSIRQLDPWTSQYVDSRVHQAKEDVDALVFSALSPSPAQPGPTYWHLGKEIPNSANMNAGQVASWLFEKIFHGAPRIVNELINKDRPASAIVLARQRLLDALLTAPRDKALFRDNEFPPERLIHATLLRDTGIWQTDESNTWTLTAPQAGVRVDICAVWAKISLLLSAEPPPTFEQVLQMLATPPLGLRHGPASIWLTLYLMVHRSNCAVFERGSLILELTSEHLQRMHKNPRTFVLRELPQAYGNHNLLRSYNSVLAALGTAPIGDTTYLELSRALYRWFGRLSDFTLQTTGHVSKQTIPVRLVLRKAQDPIKLLTETLPEAHAQSKSTRPFQDWLSEILTDLGMAQRRLQNTVSAELGQAFDIVGPLTALRNQLQVECSRTATRLADAKLKNFILRCTDLTLTDEKWLDSIASLLVQRPLDAWTDETTDRFAQAITEIAGHYRRWLRLVMQRKEVPHATGRFVSLTITGAGGQESALLVATTGQSSKLSRNILDLLKRETGTDTQAATVALVHALQDLRAMQVQPHDTEEDRHGKREAG